MIKAQISGRRAVWGWSLFDFANSPFTTLVVTFVYATYFTQAIASDPTRGTVQWSSAVTLTAIVVALLSPGLGAVADRGGYRKRFLGLSTILCVGATAALYWVKPGQVFAALAIFVIANVAFEMGMVFYNAFLPDLAKPSEIGRISGNGWALGYLGGLVALGVAFVGFIQPEVPWFGLDAESGQNVRATNLLVAGWLALFSVPLFLWVGEDKSRVDKGGSLIASSYRQLIGTFREIRRYRQIVRFLIARLLYNDGLVTIFAFGGIYAASTFGFTLNEILIFGIVLNVMAGLGAFLLGFVDDRLGGKRTIQVSLVGLVVATALAVFAPSKAMFWVAGVLVGIFAGPNQSASRSLMGRFVPPERENEFFGFFAFSGKATAFLGPFLLGQITQWTGSQRGGIAVVGVLLLLGLVFLVRVDEREGTELAAR